jgi:hypothetical protein
VIVGLDIATATGVAAWWKGGDDPELATILCASDAHEVGRACEILRAHLAVLHASEPITHLFKESTIVPHARLNKQTGRVSMATNQATVYKLNALAGMAEWFAHRIDAICRDVDQQDWRKHFLGSAKGNTAELKERALRMARMHGWSPSTDHEAEAAGVLDYGCACFNIKTPWRDRALLGGARILDGRK